MKTGGLRATVRSVWFDPSALRTGARGVCLIVALVSGCALFRATAATVQRAQAVLKHTKPGAACAAGACDDESQDLDDELTDPTDLEEEPAVPAPDRAGRPR